MAIYKSVTELIGNTPLVRLHRIPDVACAQILVKVEGLNVGGSIKTRTALNMLAPALVLFLIRILVNQNTLSMATGGAAGWFMVKKTMDELDYEYKDGQNILKVRKNY